MIKNKIVVAGLVGALAMPMGLAACGNQASSSASSQTAQTQAATPNTPATPESTTLYWQGTLSSGQTVVYMEDETGEQGFLAIFEKDITDGKSWGGKLVTKGDKLSITDDVSSETITFAPKDLSSDHKSLTLNIDGTGEVKMKAVTLDEFTALVGDALNKATVYWEGTLSDGQIVTYMADTEAKTGTLGIAKADNSSSKTWSGTLVESAGKATITDDTTKETVTFTTTAGSSTSSLKLNIDGYGEVTMKAISAEEFAKRLGDEINNAILYWEGTMADGSSVNYMEDEESKECTLSIVKADLSDAHVWSGAVTENAGKFTITDSETKETVSLTATTAADASSVKLVIDGYGEVTMTPVTGGEFSTALNQAISALQ